MPSAKPLVMALLLMLACGNLPSLEAFLLPASTPVPKLRSTTPSTTALTAHSHLQAALQLIQGAAFFPSATSTSGTRRVYWHLCVMPV